MTGIVAKLAAAVAAIWLAAGAARAAEIRLVMVEQAGCRYCIEWDREIAPAYPKSAEGRFAPLSRVQRDDPLLKGFKPVIYTPTFLVVSGKQEVGRVTGYAGKLYFWEELDEQLAKAGFNPGWGIPPETDAKQSPERGAAHSTPRSIRHGAR